MDNYIVIKDLSSLEAKSILKPIFFESSHSIDSGNDFTMKIPFRPSDDINLGDWIAYPDAVEFSGIIYSREIDKKNGIATYKGTTTLGVLAGCPSPGITSRRFTFYDPNGTMFYRYMNDDPTNPYYKAPNIFNWLAAAAGYPVGFSEDGYIPQETFEMLGKHAVYSDQDFYYIYLDVMMEDGQSIFDLIRNYYRLTWQKAIVTDGVGANVFMVTTKPRESKTYVVTNEDAVFVTSMNYNGARNSSYLVYITNDGKVSSPGLVSGMPYANAMYKGLMQRQKYFGHEDNVSQEMLIQNCTEFMNSSLTDGKITINPTKMSADIGDLIRFYDPELHLMTDYKVLTEKVLTINSGNVKLDYVLGG